MLYHGTNIGGLRYIQANSKSHTTGKSVAYFTEDRCYALVCCREREFNFVTMGLREDGKQHYFERFPDQLRVLCQGKKGYLYLQKLVCGIDLHIGNILRDLPQKLHPLLPGEHGSLFSGVDHDTDDELIEDIRRTANNIQMAVGHRVEAAGVNGNFHSLSSWNSLRKIVMSVFPYL